MEKFFKLKENGTTALTETVAGITTFFTMAYIIVVNPNVLSQAGMEWGAVFLATIIASIIGTLVMGLFANVPYAQAPGMGLNAFFVYTVCFALGFTWQQALSMVFLCGIINILITVTKLPLVLITIFSLSISDTFDTIGGFIGTGRRSGIFSAEDEKAMASSSGFKSKMDKALFADAIATSVGADFGTSNTTTFVESAAGIEAGGRTGLTSVVVSLCFALSAFLASFISAIPSAATAPALVVVGIMMTSAFKEIRWEDFSEAVPAFFAGLFMALCYSISYGIAFGFISYCIVKICRKQAGTVHPIIWTASALFILNFALLAVI